MKNKALSDKERHVLMHALTGGLETKVYRNFFAAELKSENGEACLGLVKRGLMCINADSLIFPNVVYFHATEKGAAAIGLELK